jgi:prepilin-type N-terminal cleavage/methylation domain-containing protein
MKKGFTLVELLVVISIIGVLSSTIFVTLSSSKNKAYMARTKSEFRSLERALTLYLENNNYVYPPDTARDVAAAFNPYISTGSWPRPGWPGSYFDWENWNNPDIPGEKIYQISVRFCPAGGGLGTCKFPNEPWASGFGVDSAVYFCIYGSCRSHEGQPLAYPGYCVNC